MTTINTLTENDILNGQLPLNALLTNSFYYPASGFDGGVVKYNSRNTQSFIYCDFAISEQELLGQLNTFYGYKILAHRSVKQEELISNEWQKQLPPNFDINEYLKYKNVFEKPFAHWAVYERMNEYDESHGAKRFSLLFICGEGVATYQALYWCNKTTAKVLGVIQPGIGFGLNWTDFRDENGRLAWVVLNNNYGKPETIFYGGVGKDYTNFNWKNYQLKQTIRPYYSGIGAYNSKPSGEVTVWEHVNDSL